MEASPSADGPPPAGGTALVLTGGGARGAWQVGLLRTLARQIPDLRWDVLYGVSAGAIQAAWLAARARDLRAAAEELWEVWGSLDSNRVFRADNRSLLRHLLTWSVRLTVGKRQRDPRVRGMVDTVPLRELLDERLPGGEAGIEGIDASLAAGRLRALALTTLDYHTGRTITWVQGNHVRHWDRPDRRSVHARITVAHVLASASLPLFFPAVPIGDRWHGDGGIRLATPLSPAIHLGADAILAVSTRHARSREEADLPAFAGYPRPAQIAGHLLNAVFLDALDQDVRTCQAINRLLACEGEAALPRAGFRPVRILALRPSQDLGAMAAAHEPRMPGLLRTLTRNLGAEESRTPDLLSVLLFERGYLRALMELGERDAQAQLPAIRAFLGGSGGVPQAASPSPSGPGEA